MRKIAVYPGTFDPVTYGHLDIIERAGRIFDELVVAIVSSSSQKQLMFSDQERLSLIKENVSIGASLKLVAFNGLLVDFAREVGGKVLIRGLRAISDFEYEFEMTQMNRLLDSTMETVFLMPTQDYFFTRSGLVKQVAYHTEDLERLSALVPPNVIAALKKKGDLGLNKRFL